MHRLTCRLTRRALPALLVLVTAALAALAVIDGPDPSSTTAPSPAPGTPWTSGWALDDAWHRGKAEWAVYDAVRPIYGRDRSYEATIFTNVQHMDPGTTTKAADWRDPDSVEVFKHNVSEMIPTENYTYRFLTTSFIERRGLRPFKLAMSSQEDCGSSYVQITTGGDDVDVRSFGYFPGEGTSERRFDRTSSLQLHDGLSLVLRGYPFDERPSIELDLVPDQTDTHRGPIEPRPATVRHDGIERLSVPYGTLETHRLVVEHPADGGARRSVYWFAADPNLRHVLVKYEGPYGVRYELARLDWWAYWQDPRPAG